MSGQGIPVTFTTGGAPVTITNLDASMIEVEGGGTVQESLDEKAPLASPALTGTPTAPTAAVGTNTTQVATMAAVQAAVAARALFTSTIPFIIPSSGSMGDNGALTATTALPQIYPQAYVWMPSNAIVAGSAAGWYYAVFSSTTVAQVFNNTYTPATDGVPVVPASPTAFVTTGPGAYTQDVAAGKQAQTYSVPAGLLGTTGRLRYEIGVRCPSNANVKTIALRAGVVALAGPSVASSTGTVASGIFQNQNSAARQWVAGGTTIAGGGTQSVPFQFTVNTALAVALNAFPTMANAADYMVVTHFLVTLEA